MCLHGVKLVTFDATNTLLKFKKPPWEYYATIGRKYGYTGTGDNLKDVLLLNFKKMNEKHPNFGKDSISWYNWWSVVVKNVFHNQIPDDTNLEVIAETLIEEFKTVKCWGKADGCDNLLHLLKSCGICCGVISNFDPRLHNILENLNIKNNFEFVLTSYEVGFSKPDKKIFQIAQNKYQPALEPSQCLHIGDDIHKDYEGARKAGWHAILIANKVQNMGNNRLVYLNLQKLCEELSSKRLKLK